MKDLPLRRGQLVTTFGPGSLVVSPEGETAIIGGLDKWFHDKDDNRIVSFDDYEVFEPRLKALLKVNKLLLPPDFRASYRYKNVPDSLKPQNMDIYIPLLRFPSWHYCPICKTLQELPLSSKSSKCYCSVCQEDRLLIQVPFVVVCENGHISDFPWREWVHEDENTNCTKLMKLHLTAGASLDSIIVECACNKNRTLRGIMSKRKETGEDKGKTELSQRLNKDSDKEYLCSKTKPWFGPDAKDEKCNGQPIAVLKNSLNVYYPNTISAIYLPGGNDKVEEIIEEFERLTITSSLLEPVESMDGKIRLLNHLYNNTFNKFSRNDIEKAIIYIATADQNFGEEVDTIGMEQKLRQKEFETLLENVEEKSLTVIKEWKNTTVNPEKADLENCFERINRVTKLRETIVMTGFNRLSYGAVLDDKEIKKGKRLLFKEPHLVDNNWLPAYKVYGEGIFFTINQEKIKKWEENPRLKSYFSNYLRRVSKQVDETKKDLISPSYVLLHTLSHIIIDELALTCGYNSSSLKERLYLQKDQLGILIYTSAGDSEGTFGGLVRMGKTERFFPIIETAIEKARWCSSDPVCMEIGMSSGQGVDKLNGAACHSCTYLPETSCELRNLFMDRTLLINDDIGFLNF